MKWFSPIQKVPFYFPRWVLWTLEDNLWWQNVVAHNATPGVNPVDSRLTDTIPQTCVPFFLSISTARTFQVPRLNQ